MFGAVGSTAMVHSRSVSAFHCAPRRPSALIVPGELQSILEMTVRVVTATIPSDPLVGCHHPGTFGAAVQPFALFGCIHQNGEVIDAEGSLFRIAEASTGLPDAPNEELWVYLDAAARCV